MSQSFEIEGKVKVLLDLQTFASGFSKREFVVEVEDGKFPQMIKFECVKDKANLLDDLSIGDAVKVNFDIRGNEYKERYYVNLNAWKIAKLESGASGSGGAPAASSQPGDEYFDGEADPTDTDDDIPF